MKRLGFIFFGLAAAIMAYWYFLSEPRHLATLTEKLVKVEDGMDEFGDPVSEEKWVKVFEPGLDLYGGAAGGIAFVGGILFVVGYRRERAEA